MPQNNEIIAFLIAIGVFVFLISNQKRLTKNFSDQLLMLSFLFYFASLCFTVTEDLPFLSHFLKNPLNFLEHLAGLICTVLLSTWTWLALKSKGKKA